MKEIILVNNAIKGDRKSFEILIDMYFERLYKEAYLRCKHDDDAREIIQETIYKAYKNIHTLKEPKYFKTWISRILINVANDFLKKNGIVDLEHDESKFKKEVVIEDKVEIKIDLYNAIILRYIQDLKIEAVAQILERPVNTVKTHLKRAIEQMKGLLKEGYENE